MKAQLTVVEQICYQSAEDQPLPVSSAYAVGLDTDEQPFGPRRFTVNGAWNGIEAGWIVAASMVYLRNDEGTGLQVQPTAEEKADIASRVVELAIIGERPKTMHDRASDPAIFALVSPGQSIRFEPADLAKIIIRCRNGKAKCSVTLYPR